MSNPNAYIDGFVYDEKQITVNGVAHSFHGKKLSYERVLGILYPNQQQKDMPLHRIHYSIPKYRKVGKIEKEGAFVRAEDGMDIRVDKIDEDK